MPQLTEEEAAQGQTHTHRKDIDQSVLFVHNLYRFNNKISAVRTGLATMRSRRLTIRKLPLVLLKCEPRS